MAESENQRIVVVGGGFAGVTLAQRLERQLAKTVEIVVISAENHMVFTPMLPEVAARTVNPLHIVVTGREMTRRTRWMKAKVTHIHSEHNEVVYEDDRGESHRLSYTHLVIACGAVVNLDTIPGMAAHAIPLKSIGDALQLGNALIGLCEAASIADTADRQRILSVVVVGAGFSGVEIAGNIADLIERVKYYYPLLREMQPRISLLQRGKRVLPELAYESLSEFAYAKLRERGVEVLLGTTAREVTAERVILGNGESIPAGLVVCTIGTATNPLIETLNIPLEQKRQPTDPDMRVKGLRNVWAIGDCAMVPNAKTGEKSPPTAQFALRQAVQLAANLRNELAGKPTQPFSFQPLGLMAAIGHRNAVAEVMGMRISGLPAWFLWRGVYLSKMPSLVRKFQVAVDWAWELLFPPNSVELSAQSERKTDQAHYAAGDYVYRKGDPAQHLFLVQRGRAAIYRDEEMGPLGTLEPGDHFGEGALLADGGEGRRSVSVRAITPLDLLRLGRGDFQRLADSMTVLREGMSREYLLRRGATTAMEMLMSQPDLFEFQVSRFLRADLCALEEGVSLGKVLELLGDNSAGFNIVNAGGQVTGYVSRTEVYTAMQRQLPLDTPVTRFMLLNPPLATPDDNAIAATLKLLRHDMELLPVVDDLKNRKLIGTVCPLDVFKHVSGAQHREPAPLGSAG
ncbi:MAG: FAD-dependent oxidoreductase [Bryobacterales bacterium]|nr:FAD-dependent oxidoreductase [Bryobacterales bacterium]